MYEMLTKYAGTLADRKLGSYLGCGTVGLEDFVDDFYAFEGFADAGYGETIAQYGIDASEGVECCDVEHASLDLLRACITWCVRGDRFCDGLLGSYAKNGFLDRCLVRLKELDEG